MFLRLLHVLHARVRRSARAIAPVAIGVVCGVAASGQEPAETAPAGAPGGPGLALLTRKALVSVLDGPSVVDNAVILVRDGKIEAVAPRAELSVPAGYEVLDVGRRWVCPGFIDLHSHVGGSRGDINDMVHQTNPGLRISPVVTPGNPMLARGLAAGVTTILFIPGSGTNMGGQGVLMKTAFDTYEEAIVRDPGSLKIAQGDNPKRWGFGMQRGAMAWNLKTVLSEGLAYAQSWEAHERDGAPKPRRNIRLDIFRQLYTKKTQISTHTQYYRLVLTTIVMLARDFGFPTYIDHGSFDSYLTSELAEKHGVNAILGPREILVPRPPAYPTDGQIQSTAWGFQQRGHPRIGFNTDAPVIPQEELPLQASMSVKYGFDDSNMDTVRGLTCVPAITSGIYDRIGSIEVGKDADLLIVQGDPVDPRSAVDFVFIGGRRVYDVSEQGVRRW